MRKFIKFILFMLTFGMVTHVLGEMVHITDATGPAMAFAAVAKNELAEKELIKHFRHKGTWLERVPSKQKWVNNDVIKINKEGADVEVLIDNNTYPISSITRTDESIVISLHKYDTINYEVTDDELYGLPYDKKDSVQRQAREALEEKTLEHALHSLAPLSNTTETPIIETSGPNDGTGRKRLVYNDLVRLKKKLDLLKVPKKGRILVLSPEHIADLLIEDKALSIQYHNHKEGAIAFNYAGFEIYEDIYSPEYDNSLNKIPFGSATTGRKASVVFFDKGTAKARGTVKRFMRDASTDPENRKSVVGFRLYFIATPIRKKGQAAIVSGQVSGEA